MPWAAALVALYRERPQIEYSGWDFTTHLAGALRGLRLQVQIVERINRLLPAVCPAYALLLFSGSTPEGDAAFVAFEALVPEASRATARTQSTLTVGHLMFIRPAVARQGFHVFDRLLLRQARG